MKAIEDLKLPADIIELVAKGFLRDDKLKMMVSAVEYFDTRVNNLVEKYRNDIKEKKYSKKEIYREGHKILLLHPDKNGKISNDYRRDFINQSREYILINYNLPHRHPLIDIGAIINVYARCYAHYIFYKENEVHGNSGEIIEALKSLYKTRIGLIRALCAFYPKPEGTWKTIVQRHNERDLKKKK